MATTSWRPVATLQANDKQEIDDFEVPIRVYDDNRSAGWIDRQDLRVADEQSTSVRKVDVKRLKRPRLVHDSQLLDSHDGILRGSACVSKYR